ncbi:carboxy terminal-processing peptidase [Endozoicomonas sp. G2_2]|uniref:carboxy terminal-processing peptidase n=1 Tax=Endozoicomonas sp. G2_2 TaxID=2821092 RepID=UPI001ADB59A3|nr:carboxy terminal-processing peptidase [Endozoicomonas sp. G2_2]MBO9468734.1 carboxy terminal-processing peptidase [Endozoicomonas sp. G2_2]
MRKLALFLLIALFVFAQSGCAADSPADPEPVPDAGGGTAEGYTPLVPESNQDEIDREIVKQLQENHYNKVKLDDAFSEKFFNAYLEELDGTRGVFLQEDIERLRDKYAHALDDELKEGQTRAAFDIYNTYQKRRIQIDQWALARIEQGIESLNLDDDESFDVDRENAPWPATAAEREALWTQQLENQVINLKLNELDTAEIEKRLTQRYSNELKQLRQTEPMDAFSAYMDAYTHSYDPHTDYFSPRRSEDFNIDMNLQLQGIGAELRSKNGYAELVRLIPGGPAAKSGKLKPTDRIIAVGQGKEGEFTDVVGMRLDETVQLIRGEKGSTVRLQISPADNSQTRTVTLVRDKIELKDQAARKQIIELERDGQQVEVGLITLPSFYNGTAKDVKQLIEELKKNDELAGIVLDLRNNGGGALGEAMKLTGLFMNSVPAVQIRDADGNVQVLGDRNDGPVYDGPLAIMVNRLSASASEIVAGALQDYGRAIVLGGQTFGKGTVQTLMPLSEGQIKLTQAKFYRVTGESTQDRGVTPDITFPAAVDPTKIGESALPNALPWDRIKPTTFPYSDEIAQLMDTLERGHRMRVEDDPDYQYRVNRIHLARQQTEKTRVSLNLEERRAEQEALKQQSLELANKHREATGKTPFEDYAAFEESEEGDSPQEEELGARPGADPDEIDAYQTESARVLLDLVEAFIRDKQAGAA